MLFAPSFSISVGIEATGLYQSAWTLGGLYVGFILQAMGADFYPRLTAVARDNAACNRLVNEQARVGMLLAGPGIVATLAFAPVVIALFYSAEFSGAVETLRWICLGVALRVITWPMGYIIVARGEQAIFFWTELAWTVVNVGLTWAFIGYFGLTGAGVAFFGSYVFHGCLIYFVVRRLSGFRWSSESRRTAQLFLATVALGLGAFYVFPFYAALAIGAVVLALITLHSVRSLVSLLGTDRIPGPCDNCFALSRHECGCSLDNDHMKILVFPHRLEVGGTQVNAIDLTTALRDIHNHEVVVFATPGPMVKLVEKKGLRFLPAPDARFHPAPARMRALNEAVRQENPDLIHVWDWWQCVDAYYTVHLRLRVPMIVTDMMMNLTRLLPKQLPTTFGTPELVDQARAAGRGRVRLLLPPVDVHRNAPGAVDGSHFRTEYGIADGEIAVVTVSRLEPWMKGDTLFRTVEAVRAIGSHVPLRFVIVGDGPVRGKLEKLADEVNDELGRPAVLFTGRAP